MAAKGFIKVVLQRQDWDCGVACLAMLLDSTYEEVLAAAARRAAVEEGLHLHQIETIADDLDCPLVRKRSGRYDFTKDTGILHVHFVGGAHVVILWQGKIIETDGTIWEDSRSYLATKRYKAGALLVKE